MSKTTIEWASHTLNFYTWDCTKVSPGCQHCYMMELAKRRNKPLIGYPMWRGANAFKELRSLPTGSVAFINSMSDTYHEHVPLAWVHSIHNAAAYLRPDVTFLLLTKRPERALALAPFLSWPKNLWIGTSVENGDYLWRLDYLLNIPAAGHFVSAEPLISALPELDRWISGRNAVVNQWGGVSVYPIKPPRKLGWVIVGGESGKERRPFKQEWAREIRDMCFEAGTPFLFKQGSAFMSGQDRLLDGREWNETPFHLAKHEDKPASSVFVPQLTQLSLFGSDQ